MVEVESLTVEVGGEQGGADLRPEQHAVVVGPAGLQ